VICNANHVNHGKKSQRNGEFVDYGFHGFIIHLFEPLSNINIVVC
jgi:hypothetical protein